MESQETGRKLSPKIATKNFICCVDQNVLFLTQGLKWKKETFYFFPLTSKQYDDVNLFFDDDKNNPRHPYSFHLSL